VNGVIIVIISYIYGLKGVISLKTAQDIKLTSSSAKPLMLVMTILCIMFVVLVEQQSRMIDRLANDLAELREENVQLSDVINKYQTEIENMIIEVDANKYSREELEIELKHEVGMYLINKVIEIEGPYSNMPTDPGGETKWGVSSVKNNGWVPATREEAIDFYYNQFWVGAEIYKVNNVRLAFALMDSMVLFGPTRVKDIIVRLTKSNSYGEAIEKIAGYTGKDADDFISKLQSELKKVIQTLTKQNSELKIFANGWNRRVDSY